ncbi:MAG: hypothetical protein ACI31E_05190, partial [Muribaculaceae bacterium]
NPGKGKYTHYFILNERAVFRRQLTVTAPGWGVCCNVAKFATVGKNVVILHHNEKHTRLFDSVGASAA